MANSGFKHNKKRNLALALEFFSRHMAEMILEKKDVDLAKTILVKYLYNDQNLKQEYQLLEALLNTRVKNAEIAARTLRRLEEEAKKIDLVKSDESKNKMLSEIAKLGDTKFFDRKLDSDFYRDSALAHTLVSGWAGRNGVSILEMSRLEDYFVSKFLTEQKKEELVNESILELDDQEINGMVIHIMQEKLNAKYNSILSEQQREILGDYFRASEEKDQKELLKKFSSIRTEACDLLTHELTKDEGEHYKIKLNEAISRIKEHHVNESLDIDSVAFHMELVNLIKEMKEMSEVSK